MEATTSFEADNKLVSLDNKNCTVGGDKKQVTCTTVVSCLKYNGINLPTSIDIEISWVLDSKKPKTPRMYFLNEENKNIRNSTMRLYRGKSECKTEAVYIADGIRDKLTPLEVEMKYNIRQATTAYTTSTVSRRRRATLDPVLDENRGNVQRDSVNIMKNCGKDNICIPDLKLEVKHVEKYTIGTNESLTFDVLISNSGEDAFEASFYMEVPQGLDYKNTKRIGENRDTSYTCSAPTMHTNTIKCDVGNPLQAGKFINFRVTMEPSKKSGIEQFYEFYMEANSTNEEESGHSADNKFTRKVGIELDSQLSIGGSSSPAEIHYNVSQFKNYKLLKDNESMNEADLGPLLVHKYDIRNSGLSTIKEIEIIIKWPARSMDGDHLMYLMDQPEVSGPVQCGISNSVNLLGPMKLKRNSTLHNRSYLDKDKKPIRQNDVQSLGPRYNTQGWATNEERQILDRDDSKESAGDASIVHQQRGGNSGHFESWQSQRGSGSSQSGRSQGGQTGTSGVSNRRTFSETHHQAANSGDENLSGSQGQIDSGNFNWNAQQGRQGGARESSSTYQGSSGGSRSSHDSRHTSAEYDDERTPKHYGGGSGAREYEYHEKWNSSSVDGGPVVTHRASKNRTVIRGHDGRTSVTETSTEGVIIGGWNSASSGGSGSRVHFDSSSHASQGQSDYEREQREYYDLQLRQREEQIRIQQEERRRLQVEQQRRDDEERVRLEEERRYQEDLRRRQQESTYTSRTQSQGQGGSGHQTSYNRESERRFSSGASGAAGGASR